LKSVQRVFLDRFLLQRDPDSFVRASREREYRFLLVEGSFCVSMHAGIGRFCQNSGFKARNYVDLYCESDWDYVNDDSRRRDTACVRAV
jgi:hypothetical protein